MQNRLINLSTLLNEYKDRIYDLILCTTCKKQPELGDQIFSEIFINVFKTFKNSKIKYPTHLIIYIKAKEALLKNKKITPKKTNSIKDLEFPIDPSKIVPVDLKNTDIINTLEHISPKERIIAVLALRHHMNINEIATIFNTSTGSILTKLNRIKADLASAIISTLKNVKESPVTEDTKLCFNIKQMEPLYSLSLMSKEEQTKASRHISRCSYCKNYYSWGQKITNLVESIEQKKSPETNNRVIFEKLEKKAIDEMILNSIRNNWKTRLTILTILIISLSVIGYYIYINNFLRIGH